MIYGDWANWLNLLSMTAMLVTVTLIIQAVSLRPFLAFSQRLAPVQQKWLLLGWAVLPFALLLMTLIQGLASQSTHHDTLSGPFGFLHWHHADLFMVGGWHSWLLLTVSLWFALRLTVFAARQWQRNQRIASLHEQAYPAKRFSVLPTRNVIAITVGYLNQRICLSRGLLEQSTPDQLEIVLAHENAHLKHRDNLARWSLDLMTCVLPDAVRRSLLQRFILVTEQLADKRAAADSDASDVAGTLVAIARLQLQAQRTESGQAALISADQLSDRVQELLVPSTPSYMRQWALICALVVLASGMLVAVDGLHHLFDIFLIHS
ncbi:MAG: hypothetical protein CMK92_03760 [Pseudomonas sp.]|nr:hypothetical protein [Pseudomonas sp.]